MTRLLAVEDTPLTDPELVHRVATFHGAPQVYWDTYRAIRALSKQAALLGDEELAGRLDSVCTKLSGADEIVSLLRGNAATDEPSMLLGFDILVCFCTFAETDRHHLLQEVEGILTSVVYDFQPVPEIAALLPATYGVTYFS